MVFEAGERESSGCNNMAVMDGLLRPSGTTFAVLSDHHSNCLYKVFHGGIEYSKLNWEALGENSPRRTTMDNRQPCGGSMITSTKLGALSPSLGRASAT